MLRKLPRLAALLACVSFPALAAAAPAEREPTPRPVPRLWAARAGEVVSVPGASEEAEVFELEPTLAEGLLEVALEQNVLVADWPVAPGERAEVLLTRHDVYAKGAVIWEVGRKGMRRVPRSRLVFLWGRAADDPDVRVMVGVDPSSGELRGLTITPLGSHELVPAPTNRSEHPKYVVGPHDLLVDGKNRASQSAWKCSAEELPLPFDRLLGSPDPPAKALHPWAKAGITSLHTATVAVDTDNEIMANKFANNTTTASNYIASLFAAMNVIYERDLLVRLLQGTTFLRLAADPYDSSLNTDSSNANKLFEFTNYWAANNGAISRAIALMLSGRGGSGAAGVAWIDQLCSKNNGYAFSRVLLGGTSVWTGDVQVTAHEIGHNFGSPHTHCYNTLGLTNPDNCSAVEAGNGCFSGTPSCPAPATYSGISGVTGTLMSYCNQAPSCSRTQVFHPTSVNLLDDKILSRVGACIFPYAQPGPTVAASTPNRGTTAGGNPVTITGTNFQNGATVTYGGVAATNVVVVNSTTITAVTPPHATGAVIVTVFNPDATWGSLGNAFFYYPPPVTTSFYTVTPCRIVDTRNPNGPLGGPAIGANSTRTFTLTLVGTCGIPSGAKAVAANVTVAGAAAGGAFGFYPGNAFPMGTIALGFPAGATRAAQTILELATDGSGTVGVLNSAGSANHLVIDVTGYFQ